MAITIGRKTRRRSRRGGRNDQRYAAGRAPNGVTADGAELVTGYTDKAIVDRAQEAGQRGLQGPDWGDNRADMFLIGEVNDAARVHEGVAGEDLAYDLAEHKHEIERAAVVKDAAIDKAVKAVQAEAETAARSDRVRARIAADRLPTPTTRRSIGWGWARLPWLSSLEIVLLVIGGGDLVTIALGFQPFGLSDTPIAGTPLTQLYLAAISSVVALLLLAEQLGVQITLLSHTLQHREDRDGAAGDETILPRRHADAIDVAKAAACLFGGGLVLYALSWMRTSYAALLSPVAAHLATPFLLLQVGIFLAATIFAAHHAHPYARNWAEAQRDLRSAQRSSGSTREAAAAAVAYYNGLLPLHDAEIAKTLYLCSAVTEDTARQGKLAAGTITVTQPEPVSDRLFPDGLPAPTHTAFYDDLTGFSAGAPGPFRRYEPADLQAVRDAEQAAADERARRQGSTR